MKRTVWVWELLGFALTSLGGTMLHFLYDWTNEATWIAPFCAVNESTWEHMKLLFWPAFIFALAESFFFKKYKCFWKHKALGIVLGLASIPIMFYTYNGAIAKSSDLINVAIFFVAAAMSFAYQTMKISKNARACKFRYAGLILLCFIGAAFVIFTFNAPHIGLFRDPITGGYGI